VEETELSIVEFFGLSRQRSDHSVGHLVELRFHRILLENDTTVTKQEGGERSTTYNFGHVIFETICFHVPNDLVAKELRHLGSLKDETGNIACGKERLRLEHQGGRHDKRTEVVISKGLNDLRNEEECNVDMMLFQHAMRVLQDEWVVAVSTLEERYGSDWRNQGPQYEVLIQVV